MNPVDELVKQLELPPDEGGTIPAAVAEAAARRRLRHAIADEGRRPRRGRLARRTRRVVLPSLIAVGLAGVLLVVAALLPGREATSVRLAPSPASAKSLLERVARVASRAPASAVPSAHQYLYLKWTRGWANLESFKGHLFAYTDRDTEQDWEAPNGSGRQRIVEWGFHFLTPADRAAWRASGEPWPAEPSTDGKYPVGAYFDNCNVPPKGPAGLSTNPPRLLDELVRRYERGHLDPAGTVGTIACMLQASTYPPLRAALYRVIERLPGIQLLGWRRDGLGRRGGALAVTEHGMREVLLIDTASANPLELEQIQVKPPALPPGVPRLPDGTVLSLTIYLERGVVNTQTALPDGGNVPVTRPVR
jgi:hypothetical protein